MTRFTLHAETMLIERAIAREWAERVLAAPEWEVPDPANPGQTRAFAAIAEAGGKILRIVYTEQAGEKRVITLFFDRRAKKPGANP
jgi:hypothetical protein